MNQYGKFLITGISGSGKTFFVKHNWKYTPIYSDGGKPELIEDDVFRIIIPLDKVVVEEIKEQKNDHETNLRPVIGVKFRVESEVK